MPPVASPDSARTFQIGGWRTRAAIGAAAALLGLTFVGGLSLGARGPLEQLADLNAELSETQESATALSDTVAALRAAAAAAAAVTDVAGPTAERSAPAARARSKSARPLAEPEPTRPEADVVLPVDGRISSIFSRSRRHPILRIRRPHLGVDISAPRGTQITAPAAGRVVSVERHFGYGLEVEIDHGNGVTTRYAHCKSALVSVGQTVAAGTPIATVGSSGLSTGPHVHYEVRMQGRPVNPLRYVFTPGAVPPVAPPVADTNTSPNAPIDSSENAPMHTPTSEPKIEEPRR